MSSFIEKNKFKTGHLTYQEEVDYMISRIVHLKKQPYIPSSALDTLIKKLEETLTLLKAEMLVMGKDTKIQNPDRFY